MKKKWKKDLQRISIGTSKKATHSLDLQKHKATSLLCTVHTVRRIATYINYNVTLNKQVLYGMFFSRSVFPRPSTRLLKTRNEYCTHADTPHLVIKYKTWQIKH